MLQLTIAMLCLFTGHQDINRTNNLDISTPYILNIKAIVQIDSADKVIFDLNQLRLVDTDIIEIPVFIESDDIINTLDFSMKIDTHNIKFESVVDHTGELQLAAFLNPNDLKLRFTSNSFSPYPILPTKVVSIRFRIMSGILFRADMQSIITYLNGDPCTAELNGGDFVLSNEKVETNKIFITPNPASDFIYINSDEDGTLDMFDIRGKAVIHAYELNRNELNSIRVENFPHGNYIARIISSDYSIKIQKLVLQ